MGENNRVPSRLAERLGDLIELSPAERAALETLEQRERPLKRGAVLLRERDRTGELYIVRQGMLMSYVLLQDGSRQILRFHFPGDMLAGAALIYRRSPEHIAALSDSVVASFDRQALAALLAAHPRLAALLMALGQIERAALTDRLAALGRTSARARVAALLLEIRNRLRTTDPSIGASFPLRLTQEEIGDATGLTAVHVNRMLRQLDREGLIDRSNARIAFVDEAAITRAANYVDRLEDLDLSWLPAAR